MLYAFADCTVDTKRYELVRAGHVYRLRRKTFQALTYLLAQAERVVSKQELCERLWPQQFISDAAIESTIKAVRQAIEDNGRDQRLVKTLYGQGYRFVAKVTRTDSASPVPAVSRREPHPASGCAEALSTEQLVVGRETELGELTRGLVRAQEGARQLVFVT